MIIVYKAVNKINNKCYIGVTKALGKRINRHYASAFKENSQLLFPRALRKYGKENFIWEILYECETKDEGIKKEIEFIKICNSYYVDGFGYNMTHGGEWGDTWLGKKKPHSEDTKKKIGLALKNKKKSDEHKKNLQIARNKRPLFSQETKDKMSKSMMGKNKGRKHSDEIKITFGNGMRGKNHSIEVRNKIREASKNVSQETKILREQTRKKNYEKFLSREYIAISKKEKIDVSNIRDFCKIKNLPIIKIYKTINKNLNYNNWTFQIKE